MTEDLIIKIVELKEKGLSFKSIGEQLDISANKARYWYIKYQDGDLDNADSVIDTSDKMIEKSEKAIEKAETDFKAIMQVYVDKMTPFLGKYNKDNYEIEIKKPSGGVKSSAFDREVVLHITDWHIGKKNAKYNSTVAKASLQKLFLEARKAQYELEKLGYNVLGIKVMFGGDIVDGDLLYPGHPNFVDMNIYEQIGQGTTELRNFIMSLRELYCYVDIYHVYGNHGRVSKFTTPKNNWDNILYMMLKTSIGEVPGITFNEGLDWYTFVPMLDGENAMLTHGDGIMMYQNIPMYGYIQAAMRWRGSIGTFKYSFIGHFHTPMFMGWNDMKLYINGCMPNDDQWALKVIKLASPPCQRIAVFSREKLEKEWLIML